jgi:SAM-dependent methyltransferase
VGEMTAEKPNYGNWVSVRLLVVPAVLSLLLGGAAFFLPPLGIVAGLFFLCFVYFAYARHAFSPKGGNIQSKILSLALSHMQSWDGEGKVLDIGCGSGALAIEIAKRYPHAQVIGIDSWGAAWESSQRLCEENARREGVAERVSFERADAASLPFDDEAFDLVTSNLVFHEVRRVRDKSELIREALRVVEKGKGFVFQDLFLWRLVYGETEPLIEAIKGWGVETVELVDTSGSAFIPRALKLPFMLGTVGILHGRK